MERIEINPKILGGKPVIKGTRIPIYLILKLLASGYSVKKIIKSYPSLKEEDIKAAIEYASSVLETEEIKKIKLIC
jgi:uncharacterized protein (DUF433 family)